VSLTVDFIAAAEATDITAHAEIVRRGRRLSFVDITVRDAGGSIVAKALATYRFG
jgi:acyl-coenzyme A thioesterase PaaI-like protein